MATRPLYGIVTERCMCFGRHILHQLPHQLPKTAQANQTAPITCRRTFVDDLRTLTIAWDEAEEAVADRLHLRRSATQYAEQRGRVKSLKPGFLLIVKGGQNTCDYKEFWLHRSENRPQT